MKPLADLLYVVFENFSSESSLQQQAAFSLHINKQTSRNTHVKKVNKLALLHRLTGLHTFGCYSPHHSYTTATKLCYQETMTIIL